MDYEAAFIMSVPPLSSVRPFVRPIPFYFFCLSVRLFNPSIRPYKSDGRGLASMIFARYFPSCYLPRVLPSSSLFCRHSAPVLDCCFHDAVHAYSGDCDNNLKMYDFNAGQEKTIGSHRAPIRCVEYCSDGNVIATGAQDVRDGQYVRD